MLAQSMSPIIVHISRLDRAIKKYYENETTPRYKITAIFASLNILSLFVLEI